jgi:hypothetical protein
MKEKLQESPFIFEVDKNTQTIKIGQNKMH